MRVTFMDLGTYIIRVLIIDGFIIINIHMLTMIGKD